MYNADTMVLIKADQLHHETMTWRRLIDFFKQENSYLKNRLAQVLDHEGILAEQFTVLAEQFQNQFLQKDDFFDELRQDIQQQENRMTQLHQYTDPGTAGKFLRQQEKLRNEMTRLEKDFTRLKNEFNSCLLKVLQP